LKEDILALIPARRDSKGVPRKNVALVNGLPLISYTLRVALDSQAFSKITVSTNDSEVIHIASELDVDVLTRPEHLSGDITLADSVIEHFIGERKPHPCSIIVYLQPTSPLRSRDHITQALKMFSDRNPRAIVSVKPASSSVLKTYALQSDGTIQGIFGPNAPYASRQEFPTLLSPNGALYIFRVEEFSDQNQIPRSGVMPFLMDEASSLDIDSHEDLEQFRKVMRKQE